MQSQQRSPKNIYRIAWSILGALTFVFLTIFIISFFMPDAKELEYHIVSNNESFKTVDIDIITRKEVDSNEVLSIGASLKSMDNTGKKIVIRFYDENAIIGQDMVIATLVYPIINNENTLPIKKDSHGNSYNLIFIGSNNTYE